MAEEHTTPNVETEVQDRGVFDFLKKNEDKKPEHESLAAELEKAKISDSAEEKKEEEKEKKPSLLQKLGRSDSSSSSSSSEEEVEEGGEKIRRKKKKFLKEKIHEKVPGEKKDEAEVHKIEPTEDTSVPIEKYEAADVGVVTHDGEVKHPEEKKTFMEKIKDKLPGGHKKPEESAAPVETVTTPPPPTPAAPVEEAEPKEKKGILEKIKEKLPGYHKADEEKKETTDH